MNAIQPQTSTPSELLEANRRFYNALWTDARLIGPESFNTWPLVCSLARNSRQMLEVAPGLRPRLPIEGTYFTDISFPAMAKLRARGALAVAGLASSLPFRDNAFDLVCALDIIEHVDDDDGVLSELSRVAMPGAVFLLAVPLHPSRWSAFDDFVGHKRRYEPGRLLEKLAAHGFVVRRSAAYGMQPKASRLLDLGVWGLTHRREKAMWWYNQLLMPLGLLRQKSLEFIPGLIETSEVDEILLVCSNAVATN